MEKIINEVAIKRSRQSYSEKYGPHPTNKAALRRLKIIEGQIRGIQKMVEDEKYCVDIINQISAVRSALNSVGRLILKRHIHRCVADAIKNKGQSSREVVDELIAIFAKEEI